MAQVNSVQREPSMEEILASIRRIIEDSDGARKASDGTPSLSASDPEQSPANLVERESAPPSAFARNPQARPGELEKTPDAPRVEIESFRAELGSSVRPASDRSAPQATALDTAQPQRPTLQPDATTRTFRLADIQAQLARETAAPKPVEPEQRPLTMVDIQREIATSAVRATGTTPAAPDPALDEMELPMTTARQPSTVVAAEAEHIKRPAAAWQDEKQADAPIIRSIDPVSVPESQSEPTEATPSAPARQAIISAAASRQVAAAFGELSEAFATRSKKTFDELAEQMLRPMLQEWLDNNLPLLVERLVREEIERVARGS